MSGECICGWRIFSGTDDGHAINCPLSSQYAAFEKWVATPGPEEVDYAEAARVMFEACRDRFIRVEQCYPAIDALAKAGFFSHSAEVPL